MQPIQIEMVNKIVSIQLKNQNQLQRIILGFSLEIHVITISIAFIAHENGS